MPLHSSLALQELDEEGRFDFLEGVKDQIERIDEVHQDEENDTDYYFLIWLKDNVDVYLFSARVEMNIKNERAEYPANRHWWTYTVHTFHTSKFLIVRTWW